MVTTQTKTLTLEQFLALPETKPASEYIAAGKIIQKPMPQGKHCLNCGTQVGWLIDPSEKLITIFQLDRQVQVIDDLDRQLILPEFASLVKLTAGDIFNWLKLE